MHPRFSIAPRINGACKLLPALLLVAGLGGDAYAQDTTGRIAAATRSQADEKPEEFLQRVYPGCRTRNDPRFSTGSGVYRGFFVSLPDGRTLWVGLETQFSTLPGRSTPSAFLELTEKLLQSPQAWKVSANGVGPIRLGMSPAAVKEACALYPVLTGAVTLAPAAGSSRALSLSHFGKRLMVAEVAGEAITRIEVLDAKLKTESGAGTGLAVADLAEQYGPGDVFLYGSGLLLTFQTKAPGIGFRVSRPPNVSLTWPGLLKGNPRVQSLVLAGSASAFDAESRPTGFPRTHRSRPGEAPADFIKRAFPGMQSSAEPEREGSLNYLVRATDGKIHRAELRLLTAGGGRQRNAGPYSVSTRELRPPFSWQMTSSALGPIRLGMKRSQLEAACEPYSVSLLPQRRGGAGDGAVLAVTHFGARLAELQLDKGQSATSIHVLDPRWKTPQKAGVGSTFKDLVRLYGNGELIIDEAEIWVEFARTCAGRKFQLAHAVPEDDGKPLWPVLLKANPKVTTVRVEAK